MIYKYNMKLLQLRDALREHPNDCEERSKLLRAIKFELTKEQEHE